MPHSNNSPTANKCEQYQRDLPQGLVPEFITPLPISPIVLYDGDLTLDWDDSSLCERGIIELNWLPSPSINYRIFLDRFIEPPVGPLRVTLNSQNRVLSGFGLPFEFKLNESGAFMTLHGQVVKEHTSGPSYARLASFHLVNFHDFYGEVIAYKTPSGSFGQSMGRLKMRNEKWEVTIDEIQYDEEIRNELIRSRGYGITHTGTIRCNNGEQFLVAEAEEILDALTVFLAFLRSTWVGPILVTYAGENDSNWLDYKLRNIGRWHTSKNWFPREPLKPDGSFSKLFEKFVTLWNDELWKNALRMLIFWYVESTVTQSPEAGIISASNALELLFWVYFVETTMEISETESENKYRSLEKKLDKLLELASVPKDIPEYLDDLRQMADRVGATASNGPKTFTKLRNSLVHPKLSYRQVISDIPEFSRIQGNQLGLLYVERILLYILDYDGEIAPRDRIFLISGGD